MLEGKPLTWNTQQMLLLGRDGRTVRVRSRRPRRPKKQPAVFRLLAGRNEGSFTRVRQPLRSVDHAALSGRASPAASATSGPIGLKICTTGSVTISACGVFRLQEPAYPLVAVVFRTRRNTIGTRRERHAMQPGTLGHFAHPSNRVFLVRQRPTPKVARLVGKRRHDYSRGHASNGVQHGHPPAVLGHATLAGRGAGHDVRGAGVWNAQYDHTRPTA